MSYKLYYILINDSTNLIIDSSENDDITPSAGESIKTTIHKHIHLANEHFRYVPETDPHQFEIIPPVTTENVHTYCIEVLNSSGFITRVEDYAFPPEANHTVYETQDINIYSVPHFYKYDNGFQQYDPRDLDYTNILEWDRYWQYTGKNYKWTQSKIKNLVLGIVNTDFSNWGALNDDEKRIASKWMVAPKVLRLQNHTEDEDKKHWRDLIIKSEGVDVKSLEGRARIYEEMRICVSHKLRLEEMSMEDSQDFYRTCRDMVQDYIAVSHPAFKQWLTNEVGSIYETVDPNSIPPKIGGFAQKSYFSQSLLDELMAIYND